MTITWRINITTESAIILSEPSPRIRHACYSIDTDYILGRTIPKYSPARPAMQRLDTQKTHNLSTGEDVQQDYRYIRYPIGDYILVLTPCFITWNRELRLVNDNYSLSSALHTHIQSSIDRIELIVQQLVCKSTQVNSSTIDQVESIALFHPTVK